MIALYVRRVAVQIHAETGRSLQEILEEMVSMTRSRLVPFAKSAMQCGFCGSRDVVVAGTRRDAGGTTRCHRCRFCGTTFRSRQTSETDQKSIPITDEPPPAIAPTIKKRHHKIKGA